MKVVDSTQVPLLHHLIDTEQTEQMKRLLQTSRAFSLINERDANGFCALHRAAAFGKTTAIKTLLAHGANVKCLDWAGETPLHWAVADRHTVNVELLLKHGANPLQACFANRTPIDLAVEINHTGILQLLYAYSPGEFDPQWLMSNDDLQGVLKVRSAVKIRGMTRKAKARMAELARRNWTKKYVVLSSKLMSIYVWSSDEQSAEKQADLMRIPYSTIVAVKLFMPQRNPMFVSRSNHRIELFTLLQTTKICLLFESAWKVRLWYDAFVSAGLLGASLAVSRIQSMYRAWKAKQTLSKLRSQMTDGLQIVQREASRNMIPVDDLEEPSARPRGSRFELTRSRSLDLREVKGRRPRRTLIKRSGMGSRSRLFNRQVSSEAISPDGAVSEKFQGQGDVRGMLKHRRTRKAVGVSLSSWRLHYFHLDPREGCILICDCKNQCTNNCKAQGARRIEFSQLLTCNFFTPMKHNRFKTIQRLKASKSMQRVKDLPYPSSKIMQRFTLNSGSNALSSSVLIRGKRNRKRTLTSGGNISSSPPLSSQLSSDSLKASRFVLSTTNGITYHFMADSTDEATKWVAGILRVLPRENVAALLIQCCFRCYIARGKAFEQLKERIIEDKRRNVAARVIQRFLWLKVLGHKSRDSYPDGSLMFKQSVMNEPNIEPECVNRAFPKEEDEIFVMGQ